MGYPGCGPWSTRLTVEACLPFDITKLVRAGVFRTLSGTLCNMIWPDSQGMEIRRVYFWWELTIDGKTILQVLTDEKGGFGSGGSRAFQRIEIVQTPLKYGPRPWFLCPFVRNGVICRCRVRILYFRPNGFILGCRKCHDLIHQSAQQHDKRIDKLLRMSFEQFRRALTHGTIRQQLLAVQANTIRYVKLRKKLDKLQRRRGSKGRLSGYSHSAASAKTTHSPGLEILDT